MAFCTNCGKPLPQNARFCTWCGKPAGAAAVPMGQPIQPPAVQSTPGIRRYNGTERQFPFVNGLSVYVDAPKDTTNEYIRQINLYAAHRIHTFRQEYRQVCRTVEGYLYDFVDLNGKYVNEAAQEAQSLMFSYGYYNCTVTYILEEFMQSPAFKALDEYHESNLELANAYLEDNYNRAVSRASNMPAQSFFGMGLGGMALSYGLSAASGAIQNKRANRMIEKSQKLTPAQEREFFSYVREEDVLYHVWNGLINVMQTVLRLLADFGEEDVFWPMQERIDEILPLFENMQNPRFPQYELAGASQFILQEFPYIPDLYPFMKQRFGDLPQIGQLEQYFYDPRIKIFSNIFPEYFR